MKIHRPLAEASLGLLNETLNQGRVLDRVLNTAFRTNRKWGKRDRHFIADTLYEAVRWKRALEFIADSDDPNAILACAWARRGYEIPDWWTWNGAPVDDFHSRFEQLSDQPRAVRESIPDWMDARGNDEIGDSWEGILSALNERAPVYVRVNLLNETLQDVKDWLESESVPFLDVEGSQSALELPDGLPKRLSNTGRLEIQDISSQQVAPFTQVESGMRVIDACAGAGGKALHLAALMQGRGEIVAMDVSRRKLDELWKRAKRAGVRNIKIEHIDGAINNKWHGWADRVLIDAPCSGLGTLRRQPDLKWRLDEATLSKVMRTQRRLLDHYPEMLRAGGSCVYATCSVLPSENQRQIDNMLERGPQCKIEETITLTPGMNPGDGFFAARFKAG